MSFREVKYCSPSRHELGLRDGTCFTKNELTQLAQDINVKVPKSATKKTILKTVAQSMEPKCGVENEETCWVDNSTKKHALSKAHRPRKPIEWFTNPRTWLNTFDILYVMTQYEDRYKTFKFLGVHPIDFEVQENGRCVGDDLCELHIKKLLEQKKKSFGMVLNLDTHTGSGFHWVALFCNFDPSSTASKTNFGIYYYDSVGVAMDSHNNRHFTKKFCQRIKNQISELYGEAVSQKFVIKQNKVRKQYKNTECGIFSMVFITQMLKNIPFEEICSRMPKDDDVQKLRDLLYSPPPRRPRTNANANALK